MDIGNKGQRTEDRKQKAEYKTAIFYITARGFELAQRLTELYHADIFKFSSGLVHDIWSKYRNLIFIMATGIVVRTIAPFLKDKKTDPAVVVLDEAGKFAISLLSGHLGGANKIAKEIADFTGGESVITTASDVNNVPSLDLWARENDLVIENWNAVPKISTWFLNSGKLRVYSEVEIELPEEFQKTINPWSADVVITNKQEINSNVIAVKTGIQKKKTNLRRNDKKKTICRFYLRPKNLVIGIGCNSNTSEDEIENAIKKTLKENNLSFLSIHSIATIDIKGNEPGLKAFADKYSFEINTFTADELNAIISLQNLHPKKSKISWGPTSEPSPQKIKDFLGTHFSISEAAFKATGAIAVAEPAAMLASGNDRLLVPKQKIGNVTVAVAEIRATTGVPKKSATLWDKERQCDKGRIYIVGTGPGSIEHITPYAQDAIRKSDVIVGYGTYLDLIQELIKDKEVISTGMTQEIDRCKKAVELAMSGRTVSVISGGDPGIYAMAGLVFEIIRAIERQMGSPESLRHKNFSPNELSHYNTAALSVEVIPGISALNACASRLGAPLMHDFAVISLSDRLTPWELIEKRVAAAAMSDFVTVLYNPKSTGRPEHINKVRAIFLRHRSTETPVGIVRGAMRENEKIVITNLRDMLNHDIDMQTTVIIGNSQTFVWNNLMITPRGYEKHICPAQIILDSNYKKT